MVFSATFATQAILWPRPWHRPDDPKDYFSGTIQIGINGNLAGWSESNNEGFDVALANYISRHYGTNWTAVQIPPAERESKLEAGKVDLVISNWTMTESRAKKVDFAGPYYIDVAGIWKNNSKKVAPPEARGCTVKDTTGVSILGQFRREHPDKISFVDQEDSLDPCMGAFMESETKTQYITADWSILRSKNKDLALADGNGYPAAAYDNNGNITDPGPSHVVAKRQNEMQPYGVAIQNDKPNVCADLTGVINDFLNDVQIEGAMSFTDAYNKFLADKVGPAVDDWHHPRHADSPGSNNSVACK